jgi:hypothetical protein
MNVSSNQTDFLRFCHSDIWFLLKAPSMDISLSTYVNSDFGQALSASEKVNSKKSS